MPIPLPLLFIAIPLIELYLILVIGGMIGALWTVALVIITAVLGVNLLRMQGMNTLTRAQRNMQQGQIPAMEMLEGVALAVAGVLLITPGFLTDALGFICLFPPTRQAMIRYVMTKASIQSSYTASSGFGGQQHGYQNGSAPGYSSTEEGVEYSAKTKSYAEPSTNKKNRPGRTLDGEFTRED